MIHGDISHREKIFNDFQIHDKYRVLLAHPQCVHHGLTLTAATTIVWYAPVTSLEIYEQANARIRSVGQKHHQQFLHLQSTVWKGKSMGCCGRNRSCRTPFWKCCALHRPPMGPGSRGSPYT